MPDGQDKSDDLIAELAKLMAAPTGTEPESKPAPRLVSAADPQPAPRPAIRIPGMDAPVPVPAAPSSPLPGAPAVSLGNAQPSAAPSSAIPTRPAPAPEPQVDAGPAPRPMSAATERPAPQSAPVARTLRIPGMDSPVTVDAVAPRQEPPLVAAQPAPQPTPAAAWQGREVPRSPAPRAEPESRSTPEPAPKPAAESRPAPAAVARVEIPAPLSMPTPKVEPDQNASSRDDERPQPAPEPEIVVAAEAPAPAPEAIAVPTRPAARMAVSPRPQPPEPLSRPTVEPEPAPSSSGDAIADLIAAELDAADFGRAIPVTVPPPAPAPRAADTRSRASVATPQRSPSPQARAAADADRFAVAPMFGPASRGSSAPQPAPQQPAPDVESSVSAFERDRDPMEEIESLIGEAVRVELTGERSSQPAAPRIPSAPAPQPQSAPVVPPLNTSFAPRRTSIKDSEPSIPPSEAAILAAAAAVSAEIGIGDTMIADEPASRPRARPERRGGGARQLIGMGVAAVLLLAAGGGLYFALGLNRGNDADAPVLTAETEPAKENPPAPQSNADSQGTVVFNDAANGAAPADEQLVSRDDSTETTIADIARPVGDGTTAPDSDLGIRQVKTITVRPDGSIVSGDDSMSGTEALPVDKPNVAAIEGADVQPSELLAALADPDAAAPAVSAETAAQPGADAPLAAIAPVGGGTVDPTVVAPVPMPRPKDRTVLVGGSNWQRTASLDNGPVDLTGGNTAPAAQTGGNATVSDAGGAYAQLSSQRSVAEAQASLKATQRRLGSALNGASLEIRRVDLGGRGIWYRVVLPTSSFQDATQACAIIKSNGGDCLPVNG